MRMDTDRTAAVAWTATALVVTAAGVWHALRFFEPASPLVLWLLPPLAVWAMASALRPVPGHRTVRLPTLAAVVREPGTRTLLRPMPGALGMAGIGLTVVALSRPQSLDSSVETYREGIDIVIAQDISGSMLARDLKPNRLEAAKKTAARFVDARTDDRIGLVVYEGEAFTVSPLTTDHRVLKDRIAELTSGIIDGRTAIGMGLATALNRLRDSDAKSKVVVLLTDGVNNAGVVDPIDAALLAQNLGIRVYTIGTGTHGKALYPVDRYPNGQYRYEYVDVEIDEAVMERIATMTGGRYFRATDERELEEIYREIDQLEKTRMKVTEHSLRTEEYPPYALLGACLLLLGFLLDRSLLRTLA
jgi:Ca-activated chloride channel family protein